MLQECADLLEQALLPKFLECQRLNAGQSCKQSRNPYPFLVNDEDPFALSNGERAFDRRGRVVGEEHGNDGSGISYATEDLR